MKNLNFTLILISFILILTLIPNSIFAMRVELKGGATYSSISAKCCDFERKLPIDPLVDIGVEHLISKSLSFMVQLSSKLMYKTSSAVGGVRFYPIGGEDIVQRAEGYTLKGRKIKPFLGFGVGYAYVSERVSDKDPTKGTVYANTASVRAGLGFLFPLISFMHISAEICSFFDVTQGFMQMRPSILLGLSLDFYSK